MIILYRYSKSYDYYDSIADRYDAMYNDKYWENAKKHISFIIEKYFANLNELRIMDIGAGTGFWAFWAAKRGALVTLVEPAKNMLNIARKKLSKYSEKCVFLNASLENVSVDGKYDAIFLFGDVISYIEDIDIVMKRLVEFSHQNTIIFGTVDNYYSYLREVIVYGSWDDYKYLHKYKKIQIGSEYGTFISRAFTEKEIIYIAEKYGMKVLEINALAVFDDVILNEKYGKYFVNEAEHLIFVLKIS